MAWWVEYRVTLAWVVAALVVGGLLIWVSEAGGEDQRRRSEDRAECAVDAVLVGLDPDDC